MLHLVANELNDPRIAKLNDKIKNYNEISEDLPYAELIVQKAMLLEEINFMINALKVTFNMGCQESSSSADTLALDGLVQYSGITDEIAYYSQAFTTDYNSEVQLIQLSKSRENLTEVLQATRTTGGEFREIADALARVCIQKPKADSTAAQQENYYYDLRKFKNFLLQKLAFELTDPDCIRYCKRALRSVNNELNVCMQRIPHLQEEYIEQLIGDENQATWSSAIESLTRDQLKEIYTVMRKKPPSEEDIPKLKQLLFPGLPHLQLSRLGGSNNSNWKILDEHNGREYMLRCAKPMGAPNADILHKLSLGPAQQLFAKTYISTLPENIETMFTLDENISYPVSLGNHSISISEYIPEGDLQAQRNRLGDVPEPNELTIQATDIFSQLTQFGQHLLANNCAHTDIKLTNFLAKEGKIVVSDTKGIVTCNENNELRQIGAATKIYLPPEHIGTQSRSPVSSAEAFMSYQFGLALYDYLVRPQLLFIPPPEDWGEYQWVKAQWSQKNPLDFSHPYFNTPQGEAMKTVISQMTALEPANRMSLLEAQTSLSHINRLAREHHYPATPVAQAPTVPSAVPSAPHPSEPPKVQPGITTDMRRELSDITERAEAASDEKEIDEDQLRSPNFR
ncbi:Protein kinase domain protein [Legionella massiliensis]|uniref:Protein kinase domain protein n=1 Tax=Legionella massiliensis TaxID=1034943 RepID=A0A078KXG8_9GAMM|nr:serine/threonine-protein kinase [Legionella massiliensis]CDZ76398.1 Protein kinase domain protein [Legionella massiliensis]CEE12136.1 Protein kinase domain protein [Legionella massiliensis]